MTLTLDEAIQLIQEKRQNEADRHLRQFDEDPEMEIINGRFGPYLSYKGNNYHLSKAQQGRAQELTFDECLEIVKEQDEKPKTASTTRRRYVRKK